MSRTNQIATKAAAIYLSATKAADKAISKQVKGYRFRGAIPEAEELGYDIDSPLGETFIQHFAANLPKIRIDENNIII